MRATYRNSGGLGDLLYSDKKHEEEMLKLKALQDIANKPATANTLMYIIPLVAIVLFGVIFAITMKRKGT